MYLVPHIIIFAAICTGLLWLMWVLQIGLVRGSLAILCRVGWTLPIFLAFFPESTAERMPSTVALQPLHVFIDDSESMIPHMNDVNQQIDDIEARCVRLGCALKVVRLSDMNQVTQAGFSPLNESIESWLFNLGQEPWLLFSDGGDWHPTVRWGEKLRGLGSTGTAGSHGRGLIVGHVKERDRNIWLTLVDTPPLSFQDQPVELNLGVARSTAMTGRQRVQLQVAVGDKTIGSVNAEFGEEDREIETSLIIPPLERGQHLLSVTAVPVGGEEALWDNNRYAQLEVLPNTVGVLHLLGAPSWDGRYLRRFLKAEPKYDLISFFILRDPWDSQQVSERELSLIPFPTKRLFEDELPNFRAVVIQNFALFQFLEQSYQQNLVEFVKNGGSMLFLGGPRALQTGDIASSALSEVLPFEAPRSASQVDNQLPFPFSGFGRQKVDRTGPYYDGERAFKIELAKPDEAARALANVIDDWDLLGEELAGMRNAKGLHHMENVTFKEGEYTPLLYARTEGGKRVPLAVASYPGKGRAIWIFTDTLWRLAMQSGDEIPRQTYHRFLQASMQWLMREEIRQPVVAKSFRLSSAGRGRINWQVELQGPATKYFRQDVQWDISVCGKPVSFDEFGFERTGINEVFLSGDMDLSLSGGERCQFLVKANHVAFGSVQAGIVEILPRTFSDSEVGGSVHKLQELSRLTGAKLLVSNRDPLDEPLDQWLAAVTGSEGVGMPSRYKSTRNFYWILERWWFWALLLCLPLEIFVRKWHQLAGIPLALRRTRSRV